MRHLILGLALMCTACSPNSPEIHFDLAPCTGAGTPDAGCRVHLRSEVGAGINTCILLRESGDTPVIARLTMSWGGVAGRRTPLGSMRAVPLERPVDVTAYIFAHTLAADGCASIDPRRTCTETDGCILRLVEPGVILEDVRRVDFIADGVCRSDTGSGLREGDSCDGEDDDCDLRVDEGASNACGGCGEPSVEVCDGDDNDCDGETDEGLLHACGGCGEPPVEVCDGVDNDCDQMTDEGVLNACGMCGAPPVEECDGDDNDCDGMVDEGVENRCGECDEAPVEECDGTDNDCDGLVDEGLRNACGECGDPLPEVCDGDDDDCDGVVDENIVVVCLAEGAQVSSEDDARSICAAGEAGCVNAALGACRGATPPNPGGEICHNGLDDDCDGDVNGGCLAGPCGEDVDCPAPDGDGAWCEPGVGGRCGFASPTELRGCGCAACRECIFNASADICRVRPACLACIRRQPACGASGGACGLLEQDAFDRCLSPCDDDDDCRPGWRCLDQHRALTPGFQGQLDWVDRSNANRRFCRPAE